MKTIANSNIELLSPESFTLTESALVSFLDKEEKPTKNFQIISELLSEIELLKEDRDRLRKENEDLKKKSGNLQVKKIQIELLSKLAQKRFDFVCGCQKNLETLSVNALRISRQNIKISSPSDKSPRRLTVPPSDTPPKLERSSIPSIPTNPHRFTSAKVRVYRNHKK